MAVLQNVIEKDDDECVNHCGKKWKWRRGSTKQFDLRSVGRVLDDFSVLTCESLLRDCSLHSLAAS